MKVNKTKDIVKYSRPFIATMLVSSGLLQLAAPVLADGTAANTAISNTATASYEDPSTGAPINATSNTVTVTVAEVAGIIVSGSGITGGTITAGNNLYYNFTLTNVGNIATQFHIPSTVEITGPGALNTGTVPSGVEYSTDGGATWTAVPAGGLDTPALSPVAVGGTVLVRVAVTVNSASGTTLDVRLGNTPNNLPNQPFTASGSFDDVHTVGGNPANGQRESSAVVSGTVGTTAKNIALATVLATRSNVSDNSTPANVADDTITYGLGLRVEGTDVTNGGITPAPLTGTDVSVNSVTSKRILVSNAIPAGTKLTAAATAPAGWTPVYTSDATTTLANAATWSTTFSANPAQPYTRVGFVSNVGTVIPAGTVLSGFNFIVTTTGATGATYTVDSMAQVFGQTSGGTTTVIYDESGDQTPNNFVTGTPLDPGVSPLTVALTNLTATTGTANGVASATYGIDTSNTNSGTGNYGEINQYIYTYTAPVANALLNGPSGAPQAEGPDATGTISNNFDFTNKSSAVPAGQAPNSTFDPDVVGFFNTVRNTGTTTANIALLPELLPNAYVDPTTGIATALPIGTQVRIYTAAGQSATYQVTATGFAFVTASGVGTSNGVAISATVPVTLENVGANGLGTYQVAVDLPAGTGLSTDSLKGFGVAINSFIGGTVAVTSGDVGVTGTLASNKTINRVYTGFIKLSKETRILKGSGPDVAPADVAFSTTAKKPAVGNIIEYKVTYKNISSPPVGTDNSILNAGNLVITEDGTTATNNWGKDTDLNGVIDTSNVVTSAVNVGNNGATITSTIELFKGADGLTSSVDQSGTTASTDVTKYINRVTTVVAPDISGTFSFKRQVN